MAIAELSEYIELQGSTEFLTKTELRQALREDGLSLSDRNITYYTSMGLIPSAIRVGGRAGAYPAVVAEQLGWVIRARARGQSIEAIRELVPMWRWLMRHRNEGHVDLAAFERLAREHDLSQEANFAVPYLVSEVMQCICGDCFQGIEWVLKDGSTLHHSAATPLTLTFVIGGVNEESGIAEPLAWTQLAFPEMGLPDTDDPACITLGVPIGSRILPPSSDMSPRIRNRCTPRRSRATRDDEREALPLS